MHTLKMFNRSLKYIVLVVVNIIVLYYFYISEDSEFDDVIFETTFVIDLLDNNKNLERKVVELDDENHLFSESIDDYKRQISQTESNIKTIKSDLAICHNQKKVLIELSEMQAIERGKNKSDQAISQLQCSDNLVKLKFLNVQIEGFQERIKQLNNENIALTSELSESNIMIDKLNKNADKFESNKSDLLEIIKTLENDLHSPIYVKKLYVTPRYCEGTKAKDVICLEKVLVMANFSKLPFTDVLIKLKAPNGNVIGELTYNPSNTNIVTFPLSDRTEFLNGDFELSFEVDNLLLVEKQSFKQE